MQLHSTLFRLVIHSKPAKIPDSVGYFFITMKQRCPWLPEGKPDYTDYHDNEWGIPVHDDRLLFEMLILEGAQAGLSWYTILTRRGGYKKAFYNFDINKCAAMTDKELEKQLLNPDIIRNKLKVYSVRKNARVFLNMQKEFGSFSNYLWEHVNGAPVVNNPNSLSEIPVKTKLSDQISKDLKKRGMSFVGSTIIYAYMQAVGLVNDHTTYCFKTKINK